MENLHLVEDSLRSGLVPDSRVRRDPRAKGYEVCAHAVTAQGYGACEKTTPPGGYAVYPRTSGDT